MKAAILETEKTTDIILKLFQPATQKESKAVSLFLLTISLLSSFLTLCIKVRESSWPQLQSSTSKGRGGGGLPEHFRMEYTIVLPTSSFITIFLVSPFGRGFCFNFLDPCIQPRSRKKNHILVLATPLTFTALLWMSPSHPLHKKVLS